MADENIMSLIQNLFIEENSQSVGLNGENKFGGFQNDSVVGGPFNQSAKLENELNSAKKLLLKKLNSQVGTSPVANSPQPQQPNASSFYSDLTTNPLLRSLTMKENDLDLNDELLLASKLFPSLNGSQLKANYNDLLNNNTTPTNQNAPQQQTSICDQGQQQNSTPTMKELPISPLSECSFKSNHLLTPGGPTSANRSKPSANNNLYSNFALINNSNGVLLQQQNNSSLVSSNLLANNLMNHSNSPISSNNSLLNSNASNLSYNASSANSFADLILGCDDTLSQNFNNYGLGTNPVSNHNGSAALKELGKLGAVRQQVPGGQFGAFDTQCTSPDSFICTEEERFESQIRSLANEIHSTIQLHMNSLHMRRESLLQQLEHIKKIYFDVLRKKKANGGGDSSAKQLFKDQTSAYANLIDQQMLKQPNAKPFDKFILPSITFSKPDSTLYKAMSTLGFLNTPAFGPFCTAAGDGLEFAVPGVNSTFTIETRNCFNDELLVGRENISIEILALFNDSLAAQQQADAAQQQLNGHSPPNHLTVLSPTDQSKLNAMQSPLAKQKCSLLLDYTSKSVIPHTFFDHNNGKYTVTYNVPLLKNIPQELIIKIHINALPINGSPLRVPVQTQKRQNWKLATTFGVEGNSVGELCRPWGVAIVRMPSQLLMNYQNNAVIANGQATMPSDLQLTIETSSVNSVSTTSSSNLQSTNNSSTPLTTSTNSSPLDRSQQSTNEQHYLIAIADRSNNRIQLIDYNSKTQQTNVINVFGSGPGTRPGMFDRPAGVCINLALGHIVVADKDNHRIQVFSLTGRYLFKFGEKGNRIGQLNYPWSVDSCPSTHQIAVSDTRNRRIQLFTPYGQYINHISLLLDSPRGVTFLPDKRLVVSDFNKHRILIYDKVIYNPNMNGGIKDGPMGNDMNGFTNLNSPKIIGFGEGSAWGEFLRPQGIAVSGNVIFCADSRNNRICIYNMLTQTFEYLSDELSLDRPADLSVIDENLMVIIDFGNNRLQILQR